MKGRKLPLYLIECLLVKKKCEKRMISCTFERLSAKKSKFMFYNIINIYFFYHQKALRKQKSKYKYLKIA